MLLQLGAAGPLVARNSRPSTSLCADSNTLNRSACYRYTAGKVPKAFKIIPVLSNWEEVLYLTDPEKWSAHAVYQATRLFISNLNAKMVRSEG